MRLEREQWRQRVAELDCSRLVFVDESGAKTNLTRLYGRAPKGRRVTEPAPHGHWSTTTLVGALRVNGQTAAMVLEGPINGESFLAYVEQVLAPGLLPADLVIMDNLSSHKGSGVEKAIAARGARLLRLPPYSPDLNPIEKMWSKVKAILRRLKARTAEALFQAIRQALAQITAQDARGWFHSCGYRNTVV